MFENLDLATILTVVIGLVSTFFGAFWLKAKGKVKAIIKLSKEVYDIAEKFEKIMEDDKVTQKELSELKKEFADVKAAWKELVQ